MIYTPLIYTPLSGDGSEESHMHIDRPAYNGLRAWQQQRVIDIQNAPEVDEWLTYTKNKDPVPGQVQIREETPQAIPVKLEQNKDLKVQLSEDRKEFI